MSTPDPVEPVGARRRLGVGAAIVVVIVALSSTVAIGVIRSAAAPVEEVTIDGETSAVTTPAEWLHVHVAGAVIAPGLYVLSVDARVFDAIAAAGGFTDDADTAAVNLARPVGDGEQLVVSRVGESEASGDVTSSDGRVNLNTADEAALDTLPRIGPALAGRIIQWREAHGRFTSVDDLLAVPGIGEKMLEGLRDLVTV